MEKRKLGSLPVSVIAIGCDTFGRDVDKFETAEICNTALDAGINFFDTADVYGKGNSERFLGRALKAHREEVVIATKFGKTLNGDHGGTSLAYVRLRIQTRAGHEPR